jgi:hypothetical protein
MNNEGGNNLWQPSSEPDSDTSQIDQSATPIAPEPAQAAPIDAEPDRAPNDPVAVHHTEIRWTASDAIDHDRGKGWYTVVIIAAFVVLLALATLAFFKIIALMTAISTGVLVVVMLVALLLVAKKPARELDYLLTDAGLTIEGQLHPFSEFRAFGVRQQGATWQLVLIPVKRFGMSATMFIQEDQGEQIVDELGAYLPMENVKTDLVDKLMRRLKL